MVQFVRDKKGIFVSLFKDNNDAIGTVQRMLARGRSSLGFFLGDRMQRESLFYERVNADRVFVAFLNRRPVGYLGFQWQGEGPYEAGLADFFRCYGYFGGCWRWWLFRFFEWRTKSLGFYVYGLKVSQKARRNGVASALMQSVEDHAKTLGAKAIYLEVHCENLGAKALYHSLGYACEKTYVFRLLRPFFGVSGFERWSKTILL